MKLHVCAGSCTPEYFEINGIEAYVDHFGSQRDTNPEYAEQYGCYNMAFFPKAPTKNVLERYSITKKEYATICEELKEELSIGKCNSCV